MSNMSRCGGPPPSQHVMTCFALAFVATACARSTSSVPTPQRPSPPIWRKSRREKCEAEKEDIIASFSVQCSVVSVQWSVFSVQWSVFFWLCVLLVCVFVPHSAFHTPRSNQCCSKNSRVLMRLHRTLCIPFSGDSADFRNFTHASRSPSDGSRLKVARNRSSTLLPSSPEAFASFAARPAGSLIFSHTRG